MAQMFLGPDVSVQAAVSNCCTQSINCCHYAQPAIPDNGRHSLSERLVAANLRGLTVATAVLLQEVAEEVATEKSSFQTGKPAQLLLCLLCMLCPKQVFI